MPAPPKSSAKSATPASQLKTRALLRMARKGPIRARDLERVGIPRTYLKRSMDRGELEQVSRGLYRLADAPVSEHGSLAEVAALVPHATIALLSALQFHQMTSEAPHAVWILIDRRAYVPKRQGLQLETVLASGVALEHGVKKHIIDGVKVRITTPAKTVADCFRYRRHVGLEVALAALKDYLRKKKGSVDELVQAARADRIYVFMRPYLEALV